MLKNDAIRQTMRDTRERHRGMACRVFEVKVVKGKLSKGKKAHFDSLFREAKWLRNAVLGSEDVFAFDRDAKSVMVKVGKVFEEREFAVIGSQMKQDIVDSVKSEIRGLATKKAKGEKVGRLKFKPYCNSIPLRQYGTTYRTDFKNNTVSVQGLRKPVKVRGLSQIPQSAEYANAKLVRKPSGLYFHITTFCAKDNEEREGGAVGIDFGIRTSMTLSTGEEVNISIPEIKPVRYSSRLVNKALVKNGREKGSNHRKRVHRLRAAYEKQTNIKSDIAKKEVSRLLKGNEVIAIQDEMIANWHKGLFGKQVQHSAMGFIKARLKTSPKTRVVPREFPSTQRCPMCGRDTPHPLEVRHYKCAYCGYYHPSRDVKSAEMILAEALRQTG